VRLRFDPPPSGVVRIVRTTDAPPSPGARLDPADLGVVLPSSGADLVYGGPRWYVPVVVDGATATAGVAVGHPGLPAVEGVTVGDGPDPDHALVRWTWPEGCTEARVTWTGPAGPGSAKVTNMKYQIDGGFRLPAAAPGRYAVTVVPGARLGRDLVWGPPGDPVDHRRA
jgi:hypothetical protein